jgi:hypothetical protein
MAAYTAMLRDPCHATLIPGFNGTDEGILSRLKTSFQTASSNTGTNGYVLWCPTYVNTAETINCFIYVTADSSVKLANTVADPLGTGTTSGNTLAVGASTFVGTATVSDFRLISACIRATYTGALQDSSGLLAHVQNLPVDTVLLGQASIDQCASVDDIFALSSEVERFGVETHETRYRPNGAALEVFKQDASAVYDLGVAGTSRTTMTNESKRFAPVFFGFAWKGIRASDIALDFVQNIEWRPETRAGFVSVVPRQMNPVGYKGQVTAWLDQHYPGWATAAASHARNAALRLATSVFTGIPRNRMLRHNEL